MEKMSSKDYPSFEIILGSSSSSRKKILSDMGYEFSVMTADIDERQIRRESPEELVRVLAEAKADAIMEKLQISEFREKDVPTLLITADQLFMEERLERSLPAEKKLENLSKKFVSGYSEGHACTVGSVLVTNLKTCYRRGGCDKAEVYFHKIPDDVIENLVNEGDVLYVAGGLLVEHPLTSPFVEAMVGTLDSVMGLPMSLTERLIKEALSHPS